MIWWCFGWFWVGLIRLGWSGLANVICEVQHRGPGGPSC